MNIDGCAIANVMNPEFLQDTFVLFWCHDDKGALLHLDLLFGGFSESLSPNMATTSFTSVRNEADLDLSRPRLPGMIRVNISRTSAGCNAGSPGRHHLKQQ